MGEDKKRTTARIREEAHESLQDRVYMVKARVSIWKWREFKKVMVERCNTLRLPVQMIHYRERGWITVLISLLGDQHKVATVLDDIGIRMYRKTFPNEHVKD